ncbi:MAG: dehydrogenase [Proteobacteria bacterium]|nr:MAG: dehydrogenase [Pseudomonadota bacterium]
MRFMIIRKADADTEAGKMPSTELLEAMIQYNEALVKAGVMRAGEGLHPTSNAVRVEFSKGEPRVVAGPFGDPKDLIAGFTIIEVASREEALAWVKRWPREDADGEARLELRQIFEADDFGDEFTPALREQEERLRVQVEKK